MNLDARNRSGIERMAAPTDNPYEARVLDRTTAAWSISRLVAILFLMLCAIPTLLMLYCLGEQFIAMYGSPTQSYRPILGAVGIGMSFLTCIIGFPISLVFKRFCSVSDRILIDLFFAIAWLPALLGLIGPFIIAWLTGSSFGT